MPTSFLLFYRKNNHTFLYDPLLYVSIIFKKTKGVWGINHLILHSILELKIRPCQFDIERFSRLRKRISRAVFTRVEKPVFASNPRYPLSGFSAPDDPHRAYLSAFAPIEIPATFN